MRELKFRAYDGSDWVYSSAVDYRGEFEQWCIYDFEKEEWLYCGEPGQYTGVNGICEGDIVTVRTKYGMDKGVVVFKGGAFMVYWDSNINFPRNGAVKKYYYLNEKNKVLGNIHDNPELLGDSRC